MSASMCREAVRLHQAGQIAEAEQSYRQALNDTPQDTDALHGLGVLLSQRGDLTHAAALIRRAIDLRPSAAVYYNSLGNVLRQQNRLEEAEAQFRVAISISPTMAEAHFNLGNALRQLHRTDESVSAYHAALALRPGHPSTQTQLGIALLALGRVIEAITPLARAVELQPGVVSTHAAYASALERSGNNIAAEQQYRVAISLQPERAEWWYGLGRTLLAQGCHQKSVAALAQGLQLAPGLPELHHHLGLARLNWYQGLARPDGNQLEMAIGSFERFLKLRPLSSVGWRDLGQARLWAGDSGGAIACLKTALELDPGDADAHATLGFALLTEAKLTDGFAEYEWRWRCPSYPSMRTFSVPLWDGGPMHGKKLLLHTEQGFGDAIQFVRYAGLLAKAGQPIVLECQEELVRLFRSIPGIQVYGRQDSLPSFDAHCPLMSMPHRLGTTLETVPADVPYLFPESAARAVWRERVAALPQGLRVGLAWAGNPQRHADYARSLSLDALSSLSEVEGVTWISLQKGAVGETPPAWRRLHDFTSELADFADTAALAANLDLVITVDTAVAHLAGALALPTWVLLGNGDVWRWMRDRPDSPWYPTLRLFRQDAFEHWQPTVALLVDELRAHVGRKREQHENMSPANVLSL